MRVRVPVDARRGDWPRLVAQADADHETRMAALETHVFTPGTLPASPVEGQIAYDAAAHKLKAWDGTTWQAFW